MKQPGVYILQCNNGRFYVGSTDDIERRLAEHQGGSEKATRDILPVRLVLFQACDTLLRARQVEYRVKKLKSRVIIERMIADGHIKLVDQ